MIKDMECEELGDQLSAYIDGELDESDRLLVEHHMETCVDCRSFVTDFSTTSSQLQMLYKNEVLPIGFEQQILQQIEMLHTQEQSGVLAWIITSCAGVMAFLTGIIFFFSPFGLFMWKVLNVGTRFGHGLYTVCLNLLSGKFAIILDVTVIGVMVAVAAFWMMGKLIRKTNLQQLEQTT